MNKPPSQEWPKTWRSKADKRKRVLATPWWECIDPILDDKEIGTDQTEGRKFKIGAIIQVGWLIKGKNGFWVGVSLQTKDQFEEVKK